MRMDSDGTGTVIRRPKPKAPAPPTATKPSPKKRKAPKPPPVEEVVNIHGIEVPVEVKSMKQRIKEEIQIVTATRRLHLDEMEEIRRMERELEEREKERERERKVKMDLWERDKKERLEEEARQEAMEEVIRKAEAEARAKAEREKQAQAAAVARRKVTPPAQTLTARMSPQQSPRRGRHKRQNSDPVVAKFSPIEERDLELEMYNRLGLETAHLAAQLADSLNAQTLRHHRRFGTITPPIRDELPAFHPLSRNMRQSLSRSSEVLDYQGRQSRFAMMEPRLMSSRSETNLPLTMSYRSRSPNYFADDHERRQREEKRMILQQEIVKRKHQLEENARLQWELRKYRESGDMTRQEFDYLRNRYQQYLKSRQRLTRSNENLPSMPMGIIRPIDYDVLDFDPYAAQDYLMYRDMLERMPIRERYFPQPSYSSSEYLVHKSELDPRDQLDHFSQQEQYFRDLQDDYPDGLIVSPSAHYGQMDGDPLVHYAREGPLMSSGHLGEYYRSEPDMGVPYEIYNHPNEPYNHPSEPEMTPQSDHTPAMPLLEEVTKRSRNLLRDIGSRPLSDDMDKYFIAEGECVHRQPSICPLMTRFAPRDGQ